VPWRRPAFSCASARWTARAAASSAGSTPGTSLRRSTSIHALSGMALTLVPAADARHRPRAARGSGSSAAQRGDAGGERGERVGRAAVGPGVAAGAAHLHPQPREPMARCTMRRIPEPSSATKAAPPAAATPRGRGASPRAGRRSPPRPPSRRRAPVRGGGTPLPARMRATASIPARPRQLSVIPGAWMRFPARRGSTSVPAGKTVSRCAATTTGGPRRPVPQSPSTFPSSSVRGAARPMARKRSSRYAARAASPSGGAGMRTSASCSASVSASVGLVDAGRRGSSAETWVRSRRSGIRSRGARARGFCRGTRSVSNAAPPGGLFGPPGDAVRFRRRSSRRPVSPPVPRASCRRAS
jgi:hypothetical protein